MQLDQVNLRHNFRRRAAVTKCVPHFLRGAFRNAMRVAMTEAIHDNVARSERGSKLFMLLPRMFDHKPSR